MTSPPDRTTISFPTEDDVDLDLLDELVEQSDFSSRSEFIRDLIASQDK